MIDEKKIIARFQKVVNEFIEKHPDEANGLEVKVINIFIELLQEEARDTDIRNNMTNADRIRAMSDEKLAEFLCNIHEPDPETIVIDTKEFFAEGEILGWLQLKSEE